MRVRPSPARVSTGSAGCPFASAQRCGREDALAPALVRPAGVRLDADRPCRGTPARARRALVQGRPRRGGPRRHRRPRPRSLCVHAKWQAMRAPPDMPHMHTRSGEVGYALRRSSTSSVRNRRSVARSQLNPRRAGEAAWGKATTAPAVSASRCMPVSRLWATAVDVLPCRLRMIPVGAPAGSARRNTRGTPSATSDRAWSSTAIAFEHNEAGIVRVSMRLRNGG